MEDKKKIGTLTITCVLTGILLFSSCSTVTKANLTKSETQEIAQYILDKLPCDKDKIVSYLWGPVSAGDTIMGTKEHVYDIPCSGYVLYIDLYPAANLFHPVQYVFLAQSTAQITVFNANSPPANMKDYQIIDSPFARILQTAQNRRAPIPGGQKPAFHAGDDTRYAVLMSGGYDSSWNWPRYWNDLQNMFITLKYVYGFPDDNIITLCSDGLDPAVDQANGQNSNPDFDGDGIPDIKYSCILSNVDLVFSSLAANFTEGDKLFVFTTDHGASVNGQEVDENLWNHEVLHDYHFADLLAAFPDCEKLCTLEPCYSGGFLDNIIVPPGPIVASSACAYNEESWAMGPDYVYDTYVFHWTAAMKGEDAYGVPVNADANGDGKVTFDEAYNYAKSQDTDNEHPQLGDYPEGCATTISLWVSKLPPQNITEPTGPDKGITGRTYSFSTSATEPDNESLYYQFDWGDGNRSEWYGPYTQGTVGNGSHIWPDSGVFSVRARAKDTVGVQCKWSTPHNITITTLPTLKIQNIRVVNGRLHSTITNIGTVNSYDMNWSISLKGGLILFGKQTTATNQKLTVGLSTDIASHVIIGFGKTTITVKLETQGEVFERNATATIMLFFIKNLQDV